MSSVLVTDRRGGVYQVVISFTYGECDRLPYNLLRRINARIEQVPKGGIKATAEFNIRSPKEGKRFVSVLDHFGEDGSFQHGSGADPAVLSRNEPPADETDDSGLSSATAGNARGASVGNASPVPSPEPRTVSGTPAAPRAGGTVPAPAPAVPPAPEEASDLVAEDEDDGLEVEEGGEAWKAAGDAAVEESLIANENRVRTVARVARAAGPRYTIQMIRTRMLALLHAKYQDAQYVATVMNRREWRDVTSEEVEAGFGKA